MTDRILRIELRRTPSRWLALVALFPLLFVGEAARGLNLLVLDARQFPFLISPLLLAMAAWHARRDRRSRMDELLATTPRPRWQRVLPPAAALAIGAVAGALAVFAVQVFAVGAAGEHLSTAVVPIVAVGAVGMLAPVSLGLALGRWLRWRFVLPLLVLYFALSVVLGDTEGYRDPPGWLLLWGSLQGTAGINQATAAVTAGTHLGQSLWAVALAGAGLIVYAATRLRVLAASLVVVAAGAAVALWLLPDRYADAYYVDPAALAPMCEAWGEAEPACDGSDRVVLLAALR
jgi:hypothetical protein